MRSYQPEELFDANGTLIPELQELAPFRRAPHLCQSARQWRTAAQELDLPDFRNYAIKVKAPGAAYAPPTDVLAHFLAEVSAAT